MRELKFRAWDGKNKTWLLGYEYPNLGGFSMMGETMAFGEYSAMLNSFSLEDWDKIKLMQYTGLKDKNGKEIYEGDVVNCNRYESGEDHVVTIKDIRQLPSQLFGSNLNYLEIIGNIYEGQKIKELRV